MIRIFSRVWKFLWRFSFFRFGTFHGPVGLLNYTIAFLLISNYGVDKYIAVFTGQIVHVAIGFYYDREVTFNAQNSKHMLCRYWRNDAISISAMYLVVFLLVDHYELHVDLATYMSWSVEWSILAMRAVPAMLIGTAITFGLNKLTTFSEANSQPKL